MTFRLGPYPKQNLLPSAYNRIRKNPLLLFLILDSTEREIPESLDFTATHLSNILIFILQSEKNIISSVILCANMGVVVLAKAKGFLPFDT